MIQRDGGVCCFSKTKDRKSSSLTVLIVPLDLFRNGDMYDDDVCLLTNVMLLLVDTGLGKLAQDA